MAKSTDLWCLTLFVPLTQEAKAKQRKVCPGGGLRGQQLRQQTPKGLPWQDPGKLYREEERPQPSPRQQGEQQQKGPDGQAGQVPCQARGGVPCQGALGKDQGGKDDVARHHLQLGGRGCPPSSTCQSCTTQQQHHVAAAAVPASFDTGRSDSRPQKQPQNVARATGEARRATKRNPSNDVEFGSNPLQQ
jgi:hypothetical protein